MKSDILDWWATTRPARVLERTGLGRTTARITLPALLWIGGACGSDPVDAEEVIASVAVMPKDTVVPSGTVVRPRVLVTGSSGATLPPSAYRVVYSLSPAAAGSVTADGGIEARFAGPLLVTVEAVGARSSARTQFVINVPGEIGRAAAAADADGRTR